MTKNTKAESFFHAHLSFSVSFLSFIVGTPSWYDTHGYLGIVTNLFVGLLIRIWNTIDIDIEYLSSE